MSILPPAPRPSCSEHMHALSHTIHLASYLTWHAFSAYTSNCQVSEIKGNRNSTAAIFLAGAKYGGPAYAVDANPAYAQGPMGVAPGYPQQGPVAMGPGYPQGYVPGGAPGYPATGPDNQRDFTG